MHQHHTSLYALARSVIKPLAARLLTEVAPWAFDDLSPARREALAETPMSWLRSILKLAVSHRKGSQPRTY